MAIYHDIDVVTSYCMLRLSLTASSFYHPCEKWVLGYICDGCVGSIAVDGMVYELLLWNCKWQIG
jgi:hypothetical protein